MAGGDDTSTTVARSLVVAKFIAQLCSSVLSSFVGLHHARAMRSPQHRATPSVSRSSLSQHQRRTQRISVNTSGSNNSHTSASDLANSRHLLQSQHMLTPTLLEARAPRHRFRHRSRSSAAPKAAASTRILRAACFSDLAFSLTGAVVTGVELFAPAQRDSFQLHFWAQAPHWSAQIASFLWIATLGLYIAKRTNRAAFDVAIAHAVIWLLVVFYWVLELYAMYYKQHTLLVTAQVVWNALAVACVVLVAASWSVFAYRWRRQARRKGAMVLSKILAYALAFFAFVSPIVVVDLVRGFDAAANNTSALCSVLLALWPSANVAIFLTKQTCLLRFFQKQQHKHTDDTGGGAADVYSLPTRQNSTRRPGAPGGPAPMLLSPHSHELKGLVIGDKIGEGIAVVYSGKWRGANVAVKMKALLIDSSEDLAEFQHACNLEIQAEAEVMKGLCHPNIVLFMEAGFYHGSICIISEYCARGSLRDVLMRSNVKHLSWPTKLRLALGICHGIQYLHNAHPPMIHRDLKSPNVLVDDSWHAKIADFGTLRFAEIVSSVQTASGVKRDATMDMTGLVGTTRWMAPEVIRGEKVYTSKVDIYSLALILWELIEGRLPFESTRWNHEIEDFVLQGMRPLIKDDLCPMRWKFLILQCWQPDPSLRPTIQQVITKLQRIAREEVWDTTAPRFTGVSSQFSATQSSLSQASFVSSTVSASFMDSPPSMLGSTTSLLRGSSLTSSSLVLGNNNTKLHPRRTQWSRLSDTLEEQQQQFAADSSDTGDSMSVAESDDEFASSFTIIEPSPDDDSVLVGLQRQQQQFPRTTTHLQQQLKWQSVLAASRGGAGARTDARELELSMSDLEMGSSFISTDSAVSDDEIGSLSNVALIESSPTGGYTVTI